MLTNDPVCRWVVFRTEWTQLYVCMHACMYVCIYVRTLQQARFWQTDQVAGVFCTLCRRLAWIHFISTHIVTYIHTHMNVTIDTWGPTHARTCTHTMHAHTHTYTHTYSTRIATGKRLLANDMWGLGLIILHIYTHAYTHTYTHIALALPRGRGCWPMICGGWD